MELIEGKYLLLLAVVHALELTAAADGPVHGIGADPELVLQLLHKLIGAARFAVELIYKGKDRDMAHGAYLKKLARLRLDALCSVNDHDGGVRCHEGTVGVLREVLMAGGVKDVDAVTLVLKLHDRGGDGDTALLLKLHPVGDGMARRGLALDRACHLYRPAVKQQLLGKRCFTRVRVGYYRERPAAFYLFSVIRHSPLPYTSQYNWQYVVYYIR